MNPSAGVKLVLEGGGSRAAYGAGFIHSLSEAGVPVRAVVGCSSGSINAAFFAAQQTGALCSLWTEHMPGTHFINWGRLFKPWGPPALAVDDMLDRVITQGKLLDVQAATRGQPELYVAVTDVATVAGRLIRPESGDLLEWLRASLAIPVGYNRVVHIQGRGYIDGGVAMPVPFDEPLPIADLGPTVVVLTRPMHVRKPQPNWWQRAFIHTVVPASARPATLQQHTLHNSAMDRLRAAARTGAVVVVDPPPGLPLSRLTRDAARLREGLTMGKEHGARFADRWLAGRASPSCG